MLTKLVKGGFGKGGASFRIRSICPGVEVFLHKRRLLSGSNIRSASSVLFLGRRSRLGIEILLFTKINVN